MRRSIWAILLGVFLCVGSSGCNRKEEQAQRNQKIAKEALEPMINQLREFSKSAKEQTRKHQETLTKFHLHKREQGDRRSTAGESCSKTADCFEDLVCKKNECLWK